ncbi:hypothetical protein [Longitalea arenae]|nr:hypothetical protein [Longitalea arenae]
MSLFLRLSNLPAGYLFSYRTITVVLQNTAPLVMKENDRNSNTY